VHHGRKSTDDGVAVEYWYDCAAWLPLIAAAAAVGVAREYDVAAAVGVAREYDVAAAVGVAREYDGPVKWGTTCIPAEVRRNPAARECLISDGTLRRPF
jgi:hypothetical protein